MDSQFKNKQKPASFTSRMSLMKEWNLCFFGFCCYLAKISINCVSNSLLQPPKNVLFKRKKAKSMFLSHNLYFGVRLGVFLFHTEYSEIPKKTGDGNEGLTQPIVGFRFGNNIVGELLAQFADLNSLNRRVYEYILEVLKVQIYTENTVWESNAWSELCLEHWLTSFISLWSIS